MQKIDIIKLYKQKNALVIDDFADMRGSVRRMLVNFGVKEVDTAATGEEAVTACSKKHYDLILCDYNLGEAKNGQQILEELRFKKLLKKTTIYMMVTAEATSDMVFGALEYQPDEYLTKPFTEPVLAKRLDRLVLEKKEMLDVNTALDNEDFAKAAALCEKYAAEKNRYQLHYRRILSDCYFKLNKFAEAKEVYENILAERPIEWAQIGLGKCLIQLNEIEEAGDIFEQLINQRCKCLEIYDCLAEVEILRGDSERAQGLLEEAIKISPNAILRQERTAEICEDNHDWAKAEKARKRVVKLGSHSVYESPEHHFALAKCISSEISHSKNKKADRVKEANQVLEQAKKKFRSDRNVPLQADIIGANVLADADQLEASKEKLAEVQGQLIGKINTPVSLKLDLAKACKSVGDHDESKRILEELAKTHGDDLKIADAIDRLSDEPLTEHGKEKAVELNKRGKELFDNKEFQKAIQLFTQAIKHSPSNIGLNLNLMLGLIKEMDANGPNEVLLERCATAKKAIEHMSQDHQLYERYQVLCKNFQKLQGMAESS